MVLLVRWHRGVRMAEHDVHESLAIRAAHQLDVALGPPDVAKVPANVARSWQTLEKQHGRESSAEANLADCRPLQRAQRHPFDASGAELLMDETNLGAVVVSLAAACKDPPHAVLDVLAAVLVGRFVEQPSYTLDARQSCFAASVLHGLYKCPRCRPEVPAWSEM